MKSKSIIKEWRTPAGTTHNFLFFSFWYLSLPQKHHELKHVLQKAKPSATSGITLNFYSPRKIASVRYYMQELELNYPTKGKVYSEEEDQYLLCCLWHYGMHMDDVYERIKKDITEFPVFRLDWFFRSPRELQRRCNSLLGMIEKEAALRQSEEAKSKPKRRYVCGDS